MEVRVPRPLTLLVADPDPLARAALAQMAGEHCTASVAAQVGDAAQLLEMVAQRRPDVIVADEGLLAADRFVLLRELHDRFGLVAVVMVTNGPEAADPLDALRAGVNSIIPKASPPGEIRNALESVLVGRAIVRPGVARALIEHLRRAPTQGRGFRPIHSALTNREWEILDLLVAGSSTGDIADRLVLSPDTVYTHIKNILRKMNVRSRAEAVEAANRLYKLRTGRATDVLADDAGQMPACRS